MKLLFCLNFTLYLVAFLNYFHQWTLVLNFTKYLSISEMKESVRENIIALNFKISESLAHEKYCDVTIKVGQKSFRCHRLILGSASEYFDAMFRGNFKESRSKYIELKEIEATTFADVVQFIYTGDVVVTESNVLNLIRASEFYNLPNLKKLCSQFIKEKIEMDVVIEDALKIFTFIYGLTHDGDNPKLVRSLGAYIRKHLYYFSNTPSFLNIRFNELKKILKQSAPSRNENESVHAIIRWMQESHYSKDAGGELLNDLLGRVNFENISPEFVKFIVEQACVREHTTSKESEIDRSTEGDNKNYNVSTSESSTESASVGKISVGNSSIPQSLYVYINTSGKATNVFTLQKYTCGSDWMFLCKANDNSDVIRIASLSDHLYSLTYRTPQASSSSVQTFSISSSVSLFDKSYLKAPPLIVKRFDLCGMNNHLYMYNRDSLVVRGAEGSEFDDEALSRGVYMYNCEIDKWISLPSLLKKLTNACMTCDHKNGLVYLIGGSTSNPTQQELHGYVQAYDPRAAAWMAITPTCNFYENGVCCFSDYFNHSLIVTGSLERPNRVECYNPVAGKWSKQQGKMNSDGNSHRLISHERSEWAFGEYVSDSSVEVFRQNEFGKYSWSSVSSLSVAVEKNKSVQKLSSVSYALECVTFKPYGL